MSEIKRDPRRLFTANQRMQIAARQRQQCNGCQGELAAGFHIHHVIPWSQGGPTEVDNGVALCIECHRVAPVCELPGFQPRRWQMDAMGIVVPILRGRNFATVSAAPGAGKTLFAAATYSQLRDAGDVGRVVVVHPRQGCRGPGGEGAKGSAGFVTANATQVAGDPERRKLVEKGETPYRWRVNRWEVKWSDDRTPPQAIVDKLLTDPALAREVYKRLDVARVRNNREIKSRSA